MGKSFAVAVVAVLLAGCSGATEETTSSSISTYTPPPTYPVTIRVVQEASNGTPLVAAEVYVVKEGSPEATDPALVPASLQADENGEVRMTLLEPTVLLVQAFGPGDGKGWTREGTRLEVGDNVTSGRPLLVEGRTVVLPLLRSPVPVALGGRVSTMHATPAAQGNWTAAYETFPVELSAVSLERATDADIHLRWSNTATAYGDLAVGLAWGDSPPLVLGPDNAEPPGPATREELYQGPLPPGDRSAGLRVVVLTNRAVVGDVDFSVVGVISLGADVPAGLAKPPCYPMLC